MEINFTKKEYSKLVEMVLIADWIIHAHEVEKSDATNAFRDLRRKLLSNHKEMGMEDAFHYAAEDDDFYETAEYVLNSPHMGFIEEYDEQSIWDLLASELAERDLAAEEALGSGGFPSREQRASRLWEIQERYEDELAENGLRNLRVDTRAKGH